MLGVTTSSSFHDLHGQLVGVLAVDEGALALAPGSASIMLSAMPMEPTRPMPSRSSGTKAMATPALLDLHGGLAHQLAEAGLPSGR